MSPSEYQELTTFFVDQLGRHHQETRVVVLDQLGRHHRETWAQLALHEREIRAFVGVTVESLRVEIRLVADGVLTANRRLEEHSRRIDANGASIEANGASIDALTQRVERLETTVSDRFADHEERLRVLK